MAHFISEKVYDGLLKSHESAYMPENGLEGCVSVIDVESGTDEVTGTSRINRREIDSVVRLVKAHTKHGRGLLRVLAAYDAQREALEKALHHEGLCGEADVVFTVDSFQGQEADVIVASLVRECPLIESTSS